MASSVLEMIKTWLPKPTAPCPGRRLCRRFQQLNSFPFPSTHEVVKLRSLGLCLSLTLTSTSFSSSSLCILASSLRLIFLVRTGCHSRYSQKKGEWEMILEPYHKIPPLPRAFRFLSKDSAFSSFNFWWPRKASSRGTHVETMLYSETLSGFFSSSCSLLS